MSEKAKQAAAAQARADDLCIVPRKDTLDAICSAVVERQQGRIDDELAPIWAEKLRHTYTKVLEIEYPEMIAEAGKILSIDTSVPPSALEWEYFQIDQSGYADWIDDDGQEAPSSATKASRFTGKMAEMGHRWSLTVFDLERAAAAGLKLSSMKPAAAKKYHARKTNWTWLFGDRAKGMLGLCNHPNIPRAVAAQNAGATSRLWANKTNAEILADLATLINSVPVTTIRQHYIAPVYMPLNLQQLLMDRELSTSRDGSLTNLWEYIMKRYAGDETGQGKVSFRILNESEARLRVNPVTQVDDSDIEGDFLLACPPQSEDNQFIRARPYTQRPPQERDLVMHHMTHSKVGGARIQHPLAFNVMTFGLV